MSDVFHSSQLFFLSLVKLVYRFYWAKQWPSATRFMTKTNLIYFCQNLSMKFFQRYFFPFQTQVDYKRIAIATERKMKKKKTWSFFLVRIFLIFTSVIIPVSLISFRCLISWDWTSASSAKKMLENTKYQKYFSRDIFVRNK